MRRASSGTTSATKANEGVCRMPVPAPTIVLSTPVALDNAAATPAVSGSASTVSPNTV
jgi:hypothetical protein